MRRLKTLLIVLILAFAFTAHGATLFNYPKFRGTTSTGTALNGGLLYTYSPGTTIAKATYKDSAKASSNTNPVVLDSNGEATVYLDGLYKMVLKNSAGVTQWTMDNVSGIGTSVVDYATISDYGTDIGTAVTAIGSTSMTLVIDKATTCTGNVTVPATLKLKIEKAGVITVSSGMTLTINGAIEAGHYQIFAGSGSVIVAAGTERDVKWDGMPSGGDDITVFKKILAGSQYSKIIFHKDNYSISGATTSADYINIPSNTHLYFEPGTVVSKPSDGYNLGWFVIAGTLAGGVFTPTENVLIEAYGTEFKYATKPSADENRHIFTLYGCKNVTILGAAANDSGGDGFNINGTSGADVDGSGNNLQPTNIIIRDCSADNNRRQGMSLCSGDNVVVENFHATNTTGTAPQSGIDIEGEGDTPTFKNIVVRNPYTSGNTGAGIQIVPNTVDTGIDILVDNHVDRGSAYGLLLAHNRAGNAGRIDIRNSKYYTNTLNGIIAWNCSSTGAEIVITDPYICDSNDGGGTTGSGFNAAIRIYADDNAALAAKYGNIHIIRPTIATSGLLAAPHNVALNMSGIYAEDLRSTQQGADKISVIDPIAISIKSGQLPLVGISYASGSPPAITENTNITLTDRFNIMTYTVDGDIGFNYNIWRNSISNSAFTGQHTVTLDTSWPIGSVVTFKIDVAQFMQIVDADCDFRPLSTTVGKYIYSNTIGSSITIQKYSATSWRVIQQIGTWAVES